MRIAYVHDQILPTDDTGVEQLINTIAGFVRHGVDGTLFIPRPLGGCSPDVEQLRQFYDVDDLFTLRFCRSLYPSWRVSEKAAHALRAALDPQLQRHDLVYTRNIPFFLTAVAAGLPVIYETYRPWPTQYKLLAPLFRTAMRAKSFLGAVLHSAYCRDEYLRAGIDGERLVAVHNGYDPQRFSPPLAVDEARLKIDLHDDRIAVGYAGRLLSGKGMTIVLEMARRRPDVLFLLIGSSGPDKVEAEAREIENVRVFPWQSYRDLPRYLFAADILLIPPTLLALRKARNTVLPMKLFQYLAAGRAILAPRAPDTAELLTDCYNALLVDPDDLGSACAGLDALVESVGLRDQLRNGALATARGLTWDARSAMILSFIRSRLTAAGR